MIQKQIVYLPVKVEEHSNYHIFDLHECEGSYLKTVAEGCGYFLTPEQLNEYTANVIRQALETAAEKATLLENGNLTYFGTYIVEEGNHYSETEIEVSKQSITDTFEHTFNKFKV